MVPEITIDPALVERLIMELAQDGAYGATGVWRTVYSPEWLAAMDRYAAWCAEAGLVVHRDAVGNVWGRLPGREAGGSVVSGSHIDSQRPGGRYDGALGALAGLVALRALREQYGTPRRTLECLAFCEEEGSRFPATNFWGSRAVTGRIAPHEADALRDYDGVTMAEAMRAAGLDPARIGDAARDDIAAFIELHIEQGPILEHHQVPVGIVTGITGLRHYVVTVRGAANHAGAFPMDLRRDPMAGAAEIIDGVISHAARLGRPAVTTVGRISAEPNYPAIIPGSVSFTIDARHPDAAALAALYDHHETLMRTVAARRGLEIAWHTTIDLPPSPADPAIVAILGDAARALGIPTRLLHSGAGHDSQVMAGRAAMAMIFVQSRDGRSHTPEEFTSVEHAVAGIRLLAAGLYQLAYP